MSRVLALLSQTELYRCISLRLYLELQMYRGRPSTGFITSDYPCGCKVRRVWELDCKVWSVWERSCKVWCVRERGCKVWSVRERGCKVWSVKCVGTRLQSVKCVGTRLQRVTFAGTTLENSEAANYDAWLRQLKSEAANCDVWGDKRKMWVQMWVQIWPVVALQSGSVDCGQQPTPYVGWMRSAIDFFHKM